MNTKRDPLIYEFETAEAEAGYTAWLQAKVAAALADPRPPIPHDVVMAELDALLASMGISVEESDPPPCVGQED